MRSNLDSTLLQGDDLAGPAQEGLAGRNLREEQNMAKDGKEEIGDEGEPQSLRQKLAQARQAMDLKEKAKKAIESKITLPASQATKNVLRWAWLSLIPSWGLSLIYINLHVFLRWVLGEKLFCKLGEEWIPKEIQAVGGDVGKTGAKAIGIIEVIGLLIIDLLLFFVIIGLLDLLSLIVSFMADPLKAIFNLGWGGIKALISLF